MLQTITVNARGFSRDSSLMVWSHPELHRETTRDCGAYYYDLTSSSVAVSNNHKRKAEKAVVKSLIIDSHIVTRFGETVMSSEVENPHGTNIDTSFTVQIPETAFISNFTMVIDNVAHTAEVKPKEEAIKMFEDAKRKNKTAGLVSAKPPEPEVAKRGMEIFTVKVTIESNSTIYFELTYLESLVRKLGVFEHRISVRPKQIVEKLAAKIIIHEPQGIKQFEVVDPTVSSKSVASLHTNIKSTGSHTKEIHFTLDNLYQKIFSGNKGISGELVVRYDVNHTFDIGSVQVEDGYFIHHFSPDEKQMTVQSKNLVFVIDISGSMSGRKIEQTREAMLAMLDWLNSNDQFMIIIFDDKIQHWPPSKTLMSATSQNVMDAKGYVKKNVFSNGGTNINEALVDAANRLKEQVSSGNLILFLTDGMPSAGVTDASEIIHNVVQATAGKSSVYSLGFGFNLNFELLQSVSYRTEGQAVRIYEEADAVKQLTDFFLQINNPLLFNIKFEYSPEQNVVQKDAMTDTSFGNYFKGSELTIAGKLEDGAPKKWKVKVNAQAGSTPFQMQKDVNTQNAISIYPQGFIEKLYVYLKIKDLIREELTVDDATKKAAIKQKALNLALNNNLVTPLTSMIIVHKHQREANSAKGHGGAAAESDDSYIRKESADINDNINSRASNICSVIEVFYLVNLLLCIMLYCQVV